MLWKSASFHILEGLLVTVGVLTQLSQGFVVYVHSEMANPEQATTSDKKLLTLVLELTNIPKIWRQLEY